MTMDRIMEVWKELDSMEWVMINVEKYSIIFQKKLERKKIYGKRKESKL